MGAPPRTARRIGKFAVRLTITVVVGSIVGVATRSAAEGGQGPAQVRVWPCRLVVKPTLLGVIEDGWRRSATLRQQCEALAEARAVVALEWGTMDSQSHALTQIRRDKEGVVVASVSIPPVRDAVELVAHELEHVLETIRGVNFAEESKKPNSGVWKAFGGFETQAALEAGRRVRKELGEDARKSGRLVRLRS
jgi:hypothetical protein